MLRRKRLPKEMTGVDVLLLTAQEWRERGELPEELLDAFREHLLEGYIRPRRMDDPTSKLTGPQTLEELRPEELVAQAVVSAAASISISRADVRTTDEVLRVGVVMAMRFPEYLKERGR